MEKVKDGVQEKEVEGNETGVEPNVAEQLLNLEETLMDTPDDLGLM